MAFDVVAGAWLRRAGRALRDVLGVPDYGRYVAHLEERHPGARPMSRDEFVAARLRARYERPGSRCC
ncbi:MAG: YbdD/YjiX family protein [Gemmatimonadaceae bacterium]